jgi:hypothetical protein
MVSQTAAQQIEHWPIDKLVFYARNPRKNDAAVDRMCSNSRVRLQGPGPRAQQRRSGGRAFALKAARKLGSWPGGDANTIPIFFATSGRKLR